MSNCIVCKMISHTQYGHDCDSGAFSLQENNYLQQPITSIENSKLELGKHKSNIRSNSRLKAIFYCFRTADICFHNKMLRFCVKLSTAPLYITKTCNATIIVARKSSSVKYLCPQHCCIKNCFL